MITLIIKGDLGHAIAAVERRGIKVFSMAWMSRTHDVHASVEDAFEDKVRNWFCEDLGPAPFPNGALLFFVRQRDRPDVGLAVAACETLAAHGLIGDFCEIADHVSQRTGLDPHAIEDAWLAKRDAMEP